MLPKPDAPSPDLPEDYYHKNFSVLVDWVARYHRDLLSPEELQFIAHFQKLSKDGQCLLVRLVSRKGPVFRQDKLRYVEINSIEAAADELVQIGLMTRNPAISLEELARVLTKAELIELLSLDLQEQKTHPKAQLVKQLAEHYSEVEPWREWTKSTLGEAFHIDHQSTVETLTLLFFGNSRQDLKEFVLVDLQLFSYEKYSIDENHRVFTKREEVNQYKVLVKLRDQLDGVCSVDELVNIADELFNLDFTIANETLKRRRARLCNRVAYFLERAKVHTQALKLYQRSHLPPARERQVRLLEKDGRYSEAWVLLSETLENPHNEHELQVAQRIAPRIAKKAGKIITARKKPAIPETYITLPQVNTESETLLKVEEIVRQALDTTASPCIYVENTLLNGLFGLWLWPEMFRGINGAFANPFQSAPLDIYYDSFEKSRPGIAELWGLLDNGDYQQHILTHWDKKYGLANRFVNWGYLRKDLIQLALQCIPAKDLKFIFKRLLFDIKSNCSGLPDLIQFYPDNYTYRMIEVKGPGDRIQDNQLRWLDYFARHHILAEIYYVAWSK